MPVTDRASNRGPAAAAGNRQALLAAARRLFAAHGYRVPLSAIARSAGVGQGSLYRHFPTRLALAFAVFDENLTELEQLAAEDRGAGAFGRIWGRVIELTLESSAFVEMVVDARRHLADADAIDADRLQDLLRAPLARAQAVGEIDPTWTVSDLLRLQRMAYGVIVTEVDPAAAQVSVRQALALIDPVLAGVQRLDRSPGVPTAGGRRKEHG